MIRMMMYNLVVKMLKLTFSYLLFSLPSSMLERVKEIQ